MLRKRNDLTVAAADKAQTALASLKKFDLYSKVHDDYRVKTNSGGLLSLVAVVVMILLFVSELRAYLAQDISDHIRVDTTLNQKLPISLNISFPHLGCDEVSVDTVDSVGENQVDVHGSLEKHHLDGRGFLTTQIDHVARNGECDSCYEAESAEKKCCNTCAELKKAYSDKNMSYYDVIRSAPQCQDVLGCQIVGNVKVNKVGGNVHVALGKSTIKDGKHVHEFNIKDVSEGFNTSHVIHRLRFGEADVPGVDSPLENIEKVVLEGAGMFHYYIKLVPTEWWPAGAKQPVYTHQYSVTESQKNVLVRQGVLTGLPGVFLVYEFNPFLVVKQEAVKPFSHFLTSVAAIIGGVFTLASLLDGVVYSGAKKVGGEIANKLL
eukprot:GHVL01025192.1.p1 GENE.GHVL01025192.1~~GHVL01025192.1.p1  ORF type:complete len:378 (-),score=50.78 GHVL01025192.1:185-1318(-)